MGSEYTLVEKPIIDFMTDRDGLGYSFITRERNQSARDGLTNVILKEILIKALISLNEIPEETAYSIYQELSLISNDEEWLKILRGDYSKTVPGQRTKKTIRLVDFINPENNQFTLTNQFKVEAEQNRIPDLVAFINGIPVVVFEAKTPASYRDKTKDAFDQIKQYEEQIPRLFYSNIFNIITNGESFLYGATRSPSQFWGYWRDPWIKTDKDFNSELEKGLYCLMEPSRLLDIIAHFVVFEKDDNKVIKKICRYQQFRAVNKIVNRVLEDREPDDRKGLIWHTQGSGKSLTMVFAVLKLKLHRTIDSSVLSAPNILILTDRIDLDTQIVNTFQACGIPNPISVGSADKLKDLIHQNTTGLTLLSTIFKFSGSTKPVKNSKNWIICIDESHRTQEQDLGAYLRATFPEAWFFGFTGTPIKKTDKNTYRNFSPAGESYLDKYGIDDAIADGATVPIKYMSRKTEWEVHGAEIDILFDQWFKDLTDEQKEEIKRKELNFATILKHPHRVQLIAKDIWENYKEWVQKDGYKAQVVAIDREAIILYKRAFDALITQEIMKSEGLTEEEAYQIATTFTVPVYSPNQVDDEKSEDPYIDALRKDLKRFRLGEDNDGFIIKGQNPSEKEVKDAFKRPFEPPYILIVCSKLLTGFDAPVESTMYLDNPLKEHNLLQAIARTNRVEGKNKPYGMIVDYVGVTKNLQDALSSYRSEDIQNALTSLDDIRSLLRQKHMEVMLFIRGIRRAENPNNDTLRKEYIALFKSLDTMDNWLTFKRKSREFIKVYESLCPDPSALQYSKDMKWIALALSMGTLHFEKDQNTDILSYSAKIREMLEKELEVTGLRDVVKIRSISDKEYWKDFKKEGKSKEELETAAVRKVAELKKAISIKMKSNKAQYLPFSNRLKEIIKRLESNQVDIGKTLEELEQISKDINDEEKAHENTGLTKNAHGIYVILKGFKEPDKSAETPATGSKNNPADEPGELSKLKKLAKFIDGLYGSDDKAPRGWEHKPEMRKSLRQEVRENAFKAGHEDWKNIPMRIEEYALKHYIKV